MAENLSMAESLAAADPVPGPHDQRLPFGALVLEFMAKIVVAAFLWLLDAAEKGWTELSNE